MAQNEMRAMRGMPLRVRSMEGLGAIPNETLAKQMGPYLIAKLAVHGQCRLVECPDIETDLRGALLKGPLLSQRHEPGADTLTAMIDAYSHCPDSRIA